MGLLYYNYHKFNALKSVSLTWFVLIVVSYVNKVKMTDEPVFV